MVEHDSTELQRRERSKSDETPRDADESLADLIKSSSSRDRFLPGEQELGLPSVHPLVSACPL